MFPALARVATGLSGAFRDSSNRLESRRLVRLVPASGISERLYDENA